MSRLLITGASGYLGQRVAYFAQQTTIWNNIYSQSWRNPALAGEHVACDLADQAQLQTLLERIQPTAIIHTAAVTPAMGEAMTNEALWAVNVQATATLAAWAAQHQARFVHVSSDAVWGGRDAAYTESDVPAPIHPYGASKAAGEALVAALNPAAAIARTSLLYGQNPLDPNTTMALAMLRGERDGVLFSDEMRCPVFVEDVAQALLELAQRPRLYGIFHLVGPQILSRFELGQALLAWNGIDSTGLPAGTTTASGLRRPSRVVVDNRATQSQLSTILRSIDDVTRR
ncbi:SDR family oxidoreductase [Herpetosiphon llansteffanensis]